MHPPPFPVTPSVEIPTLLLKLWGGAASTNRNPSGYDGCRDRPSSA